MLWYFLIRSPLFASTVTHWGQQVFYLPSAIPVSESSVQINGTMEMKRTKELARLYTAHFKMNENSTIATTANTLELSYQIV
jgi:hypothetical protein